ncbi:MAG: polysaccharide deacetylase family protein [Bacteroidetes bacterium MedPE-SWsnd-G2]|nr:MAG: polysaccharide deacetylase family protein [Bacteroidetes bacterium MedPE-SWsnd-G2]
MTLIPTVTPKLIRRLFPNYLWKKTETDKVLYLTFDDGPTPEVTQEVLKLLKAYNAKATFFCIGDNVKKYPEIFKAIIDEGHQYGNHTFNHYNGWKTTYNDYIANVGLCETEISKHTSKSSKLFRPPYGRIKNQQAKQLLAQGFKIVMWDVLSFDWKQNLSAIKCFNKVKQNASSGSIIVFHDSKKASQRMLYALPKTLEYFSGLGYKFKSL